MPRKQIAMSSTPNKLRQRTLLGYIQSSSSPTRPIASQSPIKKKQTQKLRVKSPSPPGDEDEKESDNDSDVGVIHFEPELIDLSMEVSSSDQEREDDDHEDASPRRPTKLGPKRKTRASSDDSDIQIIGASVGNKGKARLRRRSDGSGSEDELVTKKRRLFQGARPQKDEDEDLMDEVDEDRIIDSRLRQRDKRSAFQKNLEKLKRRQRGQAAAEDSSSSETISDGTNESDADFITPFEGAKPDNGDDSQHDEDTVDDSFIVEDDGTETVELPMEFSMNTHQDLATHFKIICQLFVHLAVRPAEDRKAFLQQVVSPDNEYFYPPLLVARRRLSGLKDQLVASSTWRSGFRKSLEKYPEFELVGLQMSLPMCDACHMGGRVSTVLGRLSGQPYDRATFEPMDDSDDDSDEDESREKLEKEFHLGRFCAKRTRVFHQFSHWEHVLYNVLSLEVEELRQTGTTGYIKVAFMHGIQPPEDHDNADGIMDWLDQRGIIDMEWQRVRQMMDSARHLDAASARGEDDDG